MRSAQWRTGQYSTAGLITEIQARSGLSQAALARRAGLPRSVMNVYIHGHREPGANILARIAAVAGFELQLTPRSIPVDPRRASMLLEQVLDLAEMLPFRPRSELQYPGIPTRARSASD